ncbi:MAG: PAS domain-containing protein [Candidatus Aminicenantes bacterium]|nr:PAS domain-containing protein [Candidatus Aminicenantes bacterium]
MKKKAYLAIFPLLVFLVLGGLNIYKKITWKEPTDGVYWKKKPTGLVAVKIETNSPGYLSGLKKGDILYSINSEPIRNKIDIAKSLWIAGTTQKVIYQINRQGELIYPSFHLTQKRINIIYFLLALIGLTTLIIGIIVFLNSKKPFTMPFVYFYFLSLAFYSFYIFSPTGEMNTLDSVFYWLDRTAFLVFPPLLLHFFFIFPQRKRFVKRRPTRVYFLYLPCLSLLLVKVFFHLPYFRELAEGIIFNTQVVAKKLDLSHFALFSLATLITLGQSALKSTNLLVKKQLKWIVYGLAFGIIPFTIIYIIPFLFGHIPSQAAELTVLLQALIPLTFAYSISRYKLMDFEVLLKKAITLLFSYVVIGVVYFIVSSQTKIFSENRLNALILGILAIILGATLFSPLKKLFQSLIDRAFYKRSYKYRKTLLFISKELSRERNLHKLSQSLLESIANALSLRSIALLLPQDEEKNTFYILRFQGEIPFTQNKIIFHPQIYQSLKDKEYLSFYSFADKKELQKKYRELSSLGFFHFMPLKVEEKMVGCLGMGKKADNTFLTTDDWDLLTTISSPVALALENAYLYSQSHVRALELERLKDYSENIIESLTVGVAVLDQRGKIIGWNRVLEETLSKKKEEVMNKSLMDVVGEKNFSALFPSDTQQDYRLLSEISLELPFDEKRIFDIVKTPLLDNKMNPYGTIVVFEDITEKISLQHQLLTSEKLASIGLLSAGVAHEINTPLTGISSYVQMLQKKLSNSSHSQILEKIEAQTERVGRIIKNLLNFARNPGDFSFQRVNLKESLQEIISLIDYKLKTMNIELELNLSSVKPIWAQGERLQQVFINIILNAIDAMPQGGTLIIDLSQNDSEAIVNIQDTGTGIKKQHLPHIFDPFFTTKGLGKGTGLGLSISYAIIKEHEGNITVESESKKGSLFTITVPTDLDKRKMTKTSKSGVR